MSAYQIYRQSLISGFWKYQQERFPDKESFIEEPFDSDTRPPVFLKPAADLNVLVEPGIPAQKRKQILNEIQAPSRHRWFRSMSSSQALAQSVLGNLKASGGLKYLDGLLDDSGQPVFGNANLKSQTAKLEAEVKTLGEPRPTSVDVFIPGEYQVAIECKLSEQDVGSCSRPRLRTRDSAYPKEHCDGNYTFQSERTERCSLTHIGILYRKFIPDLFEWQGDRDHKPCPLHKNYQLVRNLLAACARVDGKLSPDTGHAVLIYDERNPEFQEGGKGFEAYKETREALIKRTALRKCSWQTLLDHIKDKLGVGWLRNELNLKYGL